MITRLAVAAAVAASSLALVACEPPDCHHYTGIVSATGYCTRTPRARIVAFIRNRYGNVPTPIKGNVVSPGHASIVYAPPGAIIVAAEMNPA